MPNWKKVIVSGSAGNLTSLSVDTFVSASKISANEFTGSLYGTASQAVSSSYSATASFAIFALSASSAPGTTVNFTQATAAPTWSFTHNLNTQYPIVQVYDATYSQIIPNAIVGTTTNTVEIRFDYSQSGYAVASNGGGLIVTGSMSQLSQSTAALTWSFAHNLNSKYVNFEVYDSNNYVVIPANILAVDNNNANLYFATPSTGIAVANFSGLNGAPNATSASYALTASYAASVGPLSQSVQITGSLTISGSSTFRNIGPAEFTGSVSVSGSINYTGNQTVSNGYVILSQVSQSLNFADDNAAATGGVPLGGLYRNGNFILIRVGGSAFTLFSGTVKFSDYTGPNCSSATEVTVSGNNDTFCTSTIFTSDSFLELTNDTYYLAFGGNYVQITITGADITPQNTATVTSVCGTCP